MGHLVPCCNTNATRRDDGEGYEKKLRVYCPINPKSVFPDGYKVMFGLANNNSWQPDARRKMMRVDYHRRVGKIGMDCSAGWVATVQRFGGPCFRSAVPLLSRPGLPGPFIG